MTRDATKDPRPGDIINWCGTQPVEVLEIITMVRTTGGDFELADWKRAMDGDEVLHVAGEPE